MRRHKALILALAVAAGAAGATFSANATDYVIALADNYAAPTKSIMRGVSDLVLEQAKRGEKVTVYNAPRRRMIASFTIPDQKAYEYPRFRKKKFRRGLAQIKKYLKAAASQKPAENGAPPSSIGLPSILQEISMQRPSNQAEDKVHVLLVGSARFYDAREPGFGFLDGVFPSDGHITESNDRSPFGTANNTGFLDAVSVHYAFTDAEVAFASELHRNRIHRFWSLYIDAMGGTMPTFTPDIKIALQRMTNDETKSRHNFTFDHTKDKVEMLRIRRVVIQSENQDDKWLSENATLSRRPPTQVSGPVKVGIRWACKKCDLDLYARSKPSLKFLSFRRTKTPEGQYFKDFLESPDTTNGLEIVEFPNVADIRKLEIMINFYGGRMQGGPDGAIRIFFDGKVYEGLFRIAAAQGNRGVLRETPASKKHWHITTVAQILGLQ